MPDKTQNQSFGILEFWSLLFICYLSFVYCGLPDICNLFFDIFRHKNLKISDTSYYGAIVYSSKDVTVETVY